MLRRLLIGAAAALTLAGCDSSEGPTAEVREVEVPVVKTQKDIDPEAYHHNVGSAMAEIPPAMKADFQKLFICEVRRNNQRPNPKPVDADYIRALTAHLKQNPAAAESCTA